MTSSLFNARKAPQIEHSVILLPPITTTANYSKAACNSSNRGSSSLAASISRIINLCPQIKGCSHLTQGIISYGSAISTPAIYKRTVFLAVFASSACISSADTLSAFKSKNYSVSLSSSAHCLCEHLLAMSLLIIRLCTCISIALRI